MSLFKKAERKQVKLKLGISGPSGSGKTFSALRIAKGLLEAQGNPNGRIALIDTENRSASLYADTKNMPAFDALELEPPYTVDKYIEAIECAIKEKYDFLIVDSVSHVWSGEGGLLQEKETLDARGGNSYTNWSKMTPKWNRFVSGILHGDIHMICTMRSKQDYVLETNEKGKQAPKKVGMAPQVREGFEYELTAVFDVDMSHYAQASKDRTNLFDGRTWKPDEKTGQEIWKWLSSGKVDDHPAPASPTQPPADPSQNGVRRPSEAQLKRLFAIKSSSNWTDEQLKEFALKKFGVQSSRDLTMEQYDYICSTMQSTAFENAS